MEVVQNDASPTGSPPSRIRRTSRLAGVVSVSILGVVGFLVASEALDDRQTVRCASMSDSVAERHGLEPTDKIFVWEEAQLGTPPLRGSDGQLIEFDPNLHICGLDAIEQPALEN